MDTFSHFDIAAMSPGESYKLLASVILPRPIAWITSQDRQGELNLAPYSFFNIVSGDPPLVAVSFSVAPDRDQKDTLANILATGEFVVHMVPEELAEAMNITATNAPRGVNEAELAGLKLTSSKTVSVPRLEDSPVSLECRLVQTLNFGGNSTLLLGRIVYAHVHTDAFEDLSKLHIDPAKLRLIGRMHGGGGYTTTRDVFHIDRRNWPLT
ncbi:MAG: flavin reductase family protein [Acidobacteriaceae bacterium]|nr:flavin reductase family protein [Acidobacteriaceae bacterium]